MKDNLNATEEEEITAADRGDRGEAK